jgi:flavin reductase (DIM6/NTAB) family NADH-FMN oxidoreductase RutF
LDTPDPLQPSYRNCIFLSENVSEYNKVLKSFRTFLCCDEKRHLHILCSLSLGHLTSRLWFAQVGGFMIECLAVSTSSDQRDYLGGIGLMTKISKAPSTILYPVPVVVVSCGTGSQANLITLAWVGTVCSDPPQLSIKIRPSRHSYGLIKDVGQFVVNIPTADQLHHVDYCGTVSGKDKDKWNECGLSPAPAQVVQVPLIADFPVNIECELRHTISLGAHDLFIGEVVAVQVDESVLSERGHLDVTKAKPLAYAGGNYHAVGQQLALYGFSKKK